MNRVTPQNALKYAAWLASQHPDAFRAVLLKVQALSRSPFGRLGRLGRLSFFGDDSDVTDTVTISADAAPTADFSTVDTSFTPDVSLTDVSFDPNATSLSSGANDAITSAIAAPPAPDPSTADASQSSGSFWSSLSSGAGAVASSVAKVAAAVVNPQTVGAVASAASAYFTAQAKTATTQLQAQTAQSIAQAQLARVTQGLAPAPISYQRNPVTGQLVPVYQSNYGPQPVTSSLLSGLTSPTVAGVSLSNPLVLGGIALLLITVTLSARR